MDTKNRTLYFKFQDRDNISRVKATLSARSLSLIILSENNKVLNIYVSSTISEKDLKSQAEKLSLDVDDYFKKLINFFENPNDIKFAIGDNTFTLTEDVNSHVRVKFFQCAIEEVGISILGNVIDDLHIEKTNLESVCKELCSENEQLHKDVVDYKTKLNELVERKIIDEQTMLSKFVSLLNEKKRRIQHLNELLEVFKTNPSLADPVEVNVNISKKRKLKHAKSEQTAHVKEEVSESESEVSGCNDLTDNDDLIYKENVKSPTNEFDELFENPVHEIDSPVMKFPISNSLRNCEQITPSTSKVDVPSSDTEILKENRQTTSDYETIHMDTQEWLDNI